MVGGVKVWQRYCRLGRFGNSLVRIVPVALLYMILARRLFAFFGHSHLPFRGQDSYVADRWILQACVWTVIFLTFFVVDATRLCERFILALTRRRTRWPKEVLNRAVGRLGADPRDVAEYLDVEVIAARTEAVGRLIVYPFVVLFLVIVSRATLFDNWSWPLSLLLVLSMSSAYAVVCAVVLRRAAERARAETVERLRANLLHAVGGAEPGAPARCAQIRLLIERVQELRQGAFAHWSHNPLVKAILLPFGGLGLLTLLEVLGAMNQ